jgi:predicted RNase H-like HicB family nuclease
MNSKVNIVIEKNETGYLVSFPELENQQFKDPSFDAIITRLKEMLSQQFTSSEPEKPMTTGQSILDIVQKFSADMTDDEINQLPIDGAEEHDHYLYGTLKQNL